MQIAGKNDDTQTKTQAQPAGKHPATTNKKGRTMKIEIKNRYTDAMRRVEDRLTRAINKAEKREPEGK